MVVEIYNRQVGRKVLQEEAWREEKENNKSRRKKTTAELSERDGLAHRNRESASSLCRI